MTGLEASWRFSFSTSAESTDCQPPEVNVRIGSLLVDFVWRNQRLVVETDGYRYHRGRVAFEDDRARDLKLRALGYDVIRLTHRQVVSSSEEVLAILEKALSSSEGAGARPLGVAQ
jgi:very-short-patch-repair endonuclease